VVGLGDINGDGADDMMYGATNLGVQIFFGGKPFDSAPLAINDAHPFDTVADVTISGLATGAFGAVMASVGDINGDSIPDFAVTARAFNPSAPATTLANTGRVFLFFGRSTDNWPSTINVTTGGCGADVCLFGSVAGAFFGWDVTGTNFDGSGASDVVISARQNNSGRGAVYVLLGGSQFNVPAGTIINVPSGNPNGFVITPPASRSDFGVAVAAVGNGSDGRGDLAIGASGRIGNTPTDPSALFYKAGEAYPPATTGLVAPSATIPLEIAVGSSGDYAVPVRAIGDFDADGFGDLALGRNFSAGGALGAAELYLRNESTANTFSAGPGSMFPFPATGVLDNDFATFIATGLHPSLGAIGDLDNDGGTELAIGSLTSDGSVALFYGPRAPVLPATTRTVAGRIRANADFTFTGSSTSLMVPNFVGDIDHDGFNDLAIIDGGSGTDRLILLH
jgi:hypothetical protein